MMHEFDVNAAQAEFARLYRVINKGLPYIGDTHDMEDIWTLIETGRVQFWPGERSAILTEIIQYPKRRVFNFFMAAGKLDELESMVEPCLGMARAFGCAVATFTGRPGWARSFLMTNGWRKSELSNYNKEL